MWSYCKKNQNAKIEENNFQIFKYVYYDYDLRDKLNLPTVIKYLTARLYPTCRIGKDGAVIPTIFQYISNKIQRYTVYSYYLETALHVSGGGTYRNM
jgi:hypothetical protein